VANPFPFSSGDVLTAADLNSIGATETSWTPNFLTGVTVGNGTVDGWYQRVNNLVVAQGVFVLGSTSAITSDIRVDVPVAGETYDLSVGTTVQFWDASTGTVYLGIGRAYGSTQVRLRYAQQSVAAAQALFANSVSSTVPFTFTTSDRIHWTMTYRAA